MSQAGQEQDPSEGAPLESMADVVGSLRAELQSIRDREQRRGDRAAALGPGTAPPGGGAADPLTAAQIDRLEAALAEALARIPEHPEQLADREELARLEEQIDVLRTSVADRLDAIQAPDLRSVVDHLERIHQQIASFPVPDLHPVRERMDGLHHEIQSLGAPDLQPLRGRIEQLHQQVAGLPRTDQLVGALAPQLDAMRDAVRPDSVLEAIDDVAATLRAQLGGVGELGAQIRQVLEPLAGRLDKLVESDTAVRDDLVLATEVLVGLTQLSEATEQHLTELVGGYESSLSEQRSLITSALADISRSILDQAHKFESQLGTLAMRISAIEDNVTAHLQTSLSRTEERVTAQLSELEGRINELDLGPVRSAIATVGQQVTSGRADAKTLVQVVRSIEARLDAIDPASFGTALADLAKQAEADRSDAESIAGELRALDARIQKLGLTDVASIRSGVDGLRAQIEALPAVDLSNVDSALTRLTTAVMFANRRNIATEDDVRAVGGSIEEAMQAISTELAATRHAVQRRSGTRWRKRVDDEATLDVEVAPPIKPEPLLPAGPTAGERILEAAVVEMDQRLTELTRLVTATARHAERAASAATAALEGVTGDSRAPTGTTGATAKKPTSPTRARATKTPTAKKAVSAKATAKKAVSAKGTAKKPASPTRARATKTPTAKKATAKATAKKPTSPARARATPTIPPPPGAPGALPPPPPPPPPG